MSRQPKFPASKYENYEMPSDDMDTWIEGYRSKLVKCRKEHKCSYCGAVIHKGDYALYERCFLDGEPASVHDCLDCVEDSLQGWSDEEQRRWEKRAKESGLIT